MLIDIHIHTGLDVMDPELIKEFYWGATHNTPPEYGMKDTYYRGTPEDIVTVCDEAGLDKAFLLAMDLKRVWGTPPATNDYVADIVKLRPKIFVGIASIDPLALPVELGLQEIERAITDLGFKGVKFYCPYQGYAANDSRVFPYYEKCVELDVPAIFHTGWIPGPVSSELSDPIYLDEVGVRYPELKVVIEHMGFPWAEKTMFLCMKHRNFYSGMAGWQRIATRYYATNINMFGEIAGFEKLLYGTEFTVNTPLEGINVFRKINTFNKRYGLPEMSESDMAKVLGDNAAKLFKLEE